MCHEDEDQRAQDIALRGTCAESDDIGGVLTRTDCGLSVRMSSNQLHSGVLKPRNPSLFTTCCGMMLVNAKLKYRNNIWVSTVERFGR